MPNAVIKVEGLSKRYRLGQYVGGAYQYRTLRDVLTDAMHAPFRRLRARVKQRAVASNPTANSHELSAMSHQPSADFIWALKDVSFEVKQGEVVGIIGRNGAGKSTLLKLLSRITEPTKGRAMIKGRLGSLLEVGTGFHPELTGRENVYLSGAILGMTKKEIDRKFDEIVDFSEIEKFIDTPVKRYSSGMLVRLGFAVAAHLEPEILLVDEVLAVGDAAFQKKCLGKMGDVASEGRTVLFVSHNMAAVRSLCTESFLLNEGVIIECGEPNYVIDSYLSNRKKIEDEIAWNDFNAPQNAYIKLKRIRVRSEKPVITVDDPVFIEILFCNMKPMGMFLNLILRTTLGEIVFESPSESSMYDRGLYEVTCKIPPNLLNTGIYSVQINFTKIGPRILFHHEDIIRFEVHEATSNVGYFGKWSGYIRPRLDWNIRVVR